MVGSCVVVQGWPTPAVFMDALFGPASTGCKKPNLVGCLAITMGKGPSLLMWRGLAFPGVLLTACKMAEMVRPRLGHGPNETAEHSVAPVLRVVGLPGAAASGALAVLGRWPHAERVGAGYRGACAL